MIDFRPASRRLARAFTLVELLVAMAALTILAIGLAEVFRVTGKTVSGGRRLSNLVTYAGMIERQMRTDFSAMTRDGFMMIRHANVTSKISGVPANSNPFQPDLIPLVPGDPDPRPHRADELVFFANGDFSTLRDPRHPARVARATSARIYYGHGLRHDPSIDTNYQDPAKLDDANMSTNGGSGTTPPMGAQDGPATSPNRYAASWALLRHVCLLAPVGSTTLDALQPPISSTLPSSSTDPKLLDSRYQVALQPAAPSIFRWLINLQPAPTSSAIARTSPDATMVPRLSSGIVDIAATDLSEIRSIILGALAPSSIGVAPIDLTNASNTNFVFGDDPTVSGSSAQRMQAWMREALPGDSDGSDATGTPNPSLATRMRYEPSPPNFDGVTTTGLITTQKDYQHADQTMLTSSIFAPRCTDFIVEWTFGLVDGDTSSKSFGRTLWYGLSRNVMVDGSASTSTSVDYYPVVPFSDKTTTWAANRPMPTKTIPRRGLPSNPRVYPDPAVLTDADELRFIINPSTPKFNPKSPIYSFFGYLNPAYGPQTTGLIPGTTASALLVDVNGNGKYEPAEGDILREPDTIPWIWPTMVRITITLADPNDPTIQQTFQFVLPVSAQAPLSSL